MGDLLLLESECRHVDYVGPRERAWVPQTEVAVHDGSHHHLVLLKRDFTRGLSKLDGAEQGHDCVVPLTASDEGASGVAALDAALADLRRGDGGITRQHLREPHAELPELVVDEWAYLRRGRTVVGRSACLSQQPEHLRTQDPTLKFRVVGFDGGNPLVQILRTQERQRVAARGGCRRDDGDAWRVDDALRDVVAALPLKGVVVERQRQRLRHVRTEQRFGSRRSEAYQFVGHRHDGAALLVRQQECAGQELRRRDGLILADEVTDGRTGLARHPESAAWGHRNDAAASVDERVLVAQELNQLAELRGCNECATDGLVQPRLGTAVRRGLLAVLHLVASADVIGDVAYFVLVDVGLAKDRKSLHLGAETFRDGVVSFADAAHQLGAERRQ